MKIQRYILLILFLSASTMRAQDVYRPPIEIGDPLPDSVFLKDYHQPYIILDFWGTWCAMCISPFLRLDSLQRKYADSIQIILVNTQPLSSDTPEKAQKFLENFRTKHPAFGLPSLIYSSWAWRYGFPVKYFPHYVWLDRERRVIALTDSDVVNANTIEGLFEGRLPYPMKLDRWDLSPNQ